MATGHADGTGAAGASQDVASADSHEFARRQRLLALLGWHAVPVPFGAVSAADSRSDVASAEAGSTPRPALQASEVQCTPARAQQMVQFGFSDQRHLLTDTPLRLL